MRRFIRGWLQPLNLWIALALLAANGLAWATALEPIGPVYTADPVLEPSLDDLRTRLREGGHSGERFDLSVTGQEAAESIAWFLSIHPEIPFRHPRIEFHPDEVEAWGEVEVLGLRLSIHGQATMALENGIPVVTLTDIRVAGAPVPGFVLEAVQDAVYEQVDLSNRELPVIFEALELCEGEAVASGTIR
jgi:hypothetical protein